MEASISSSGKRRLPQENRAESQLVVTISTEMVTAGLVRARFSGRFL
jgi:hypothetical protein